MPLPNDLAIEHLALRIMDRTLPKVEWTHEGHFASALWLLRHHRDLTTPGEIRTLITRYNEATNTPNTDHSGYHHTITLASMRAADHHLRRCDAEAPLHEVLRSLMASPLGHSEWPLRYWNRDTLFSVAARRAWVGPDRAPLPFQE
jgi:hypothetical protein